MLPTLGPSAQVGSYRRFSRSEPFNLHSKAHRHRLENPGKIPLQIIEIQSGPYLEEDDLVRFENVYGRSLNFFRLFVRRSPILK